MAAHDDAASGQGGRGIPAFWLYLPLAYLAALLLCFGAIGFWGLFCPEGGGPIARFSCPGWLASLGSFGRLAGETLAFPMERLLNLAFPGELAASLNVLLGNTALASLLGLAAGIAARFVFPPARENAGEKIN